MGLSSSQARLLHLTGRMHQIEYKAAKLEAEKLQMANESKRVYEDYQNALEATKIQHKFLNSDGSVTFTDVSYSDLCFGTYGERYALLSPDNGKVYVNQDIYNTFNSYPTSPSGFATQMTGYTPPVVPTFTPTVPYSAPVTNPQSNNTDITLERSNSSNNGASETIKAGNTINLTLQNLIGTGNYQYTVETNDSTSDADINVQLLDNGRLVISGNNLKITATGSQNDDIILLGNNNYLSTGDGDDIVRIASARDTEGVYSGTATNNTVDTGSGTDHVTVANTGNTINNSESILYNSSSIQFGTIVGGSPTSVNVATNNNITSQAVDTIDGYAAQTGSSDCRLFSLINSLCGNTNRGDLSQYVAITTTSSGYNVKFKNYPAGAGQSNNIDVSKSEAENYNGVSGDLTTVLIDIAINKLMAQNKDDIVLQSSKTTADNAFSRADYQTVSKYFFGNTNFVMYNTDTDSLSTVESKLISIWKDYKSHSNGVTNLLTGFSSDNDALGIHSAHAYSVKNINYSGSTINYIEVVNPWDDGDVVRLDGNTFRKYVSDCYTFGSSKYNDSTPIHNAELNGTDEAATESITVINNASTGNEDEWYYYFNLHQEINANGMVVIDDTNATSKQWLSNVLNGGLAYLKVLDNKTHSFANTSVATNTSLQEVSDESNLRKAEAKYEADMKRIDNKDKKYDYDLAALENERNATKEEMETLKTVAKDNVDRTFKLFG